MGETLQDFSSSHTSIKFFLHKYLDVTFIFHIFAVIIQPNHF